MHGLLVALRERKAFFGQRRVVSMAIMGCDDVSLARSQGERWQMHEIYQHVVRAPTMAAHLISGGAGANRNIATLTKIHQHGQQ